MSEKTASLRAFQTLSVSSPALLQICILHRSSSEASIWNVNNALFNSINTGFGLQAPLHSPKIPFVAGGDFNLKNVDIQMRWNTRPGFCSEVSATCTIQSVLHTKSDYETLISIKTRILNCKIVAFRYYTAHWRGPSDFEKIQLRAAFGKLCSPETLTLPSPKIEDIFDSVLTVASHWIKLEPISEVEVFSTTCKVSSTSPGEDELIVPIIRSALNTLNHRGAILQRSAVDLEMALICDIRKALIDRKVAKTATVNIKGAFDDALCNRSPMPTNTRMARNSNDGCKLATARTPDDYGHKLESKFNQTLQWGRESSIIFDNAKTELEYFQNKRKYTEPSLHIRADVMKPKELYAS
ncbi:hypothetical protein EPUL_000419 [Erysiphe pulchra]|uniref:Uncharacterized protein n=1 Tax=Erysiphe pulchra TaxID=225359 RepID=A0A2S4Q0P9_9PEZI|nr:hypothetical protein EPUL_000419 [Erysiphe pulchra]